MKIKRSLRNAYLQISRNPYLSIATIFAIGIMLFVLNIIITINILGEKTIQTIEQKVDIIVYLEKDAELTKVQELIQNLETQPSVISALYTSEEQALKDFFDTFPGQKADFEKLDITNPLPPSIQIISSDPSEHENIQRFIEQPEWQGVLSNLNILDKSDGITEKVINTTTFSKRVLIALLLAFVISSGLIIANAIQLNIQSKKREIEIMKFVGAPFGHIRLPFIIEGVFYSLLSIFMAIILLYFFIKSIGLNTDGLVSIQSVINILLIESIAILFLGLFSSVISVNRYLNSHKT